MMDFKPIDYKNDIPEIVALLRTSLSINHTQENFRWKHEKNPFGRSYGLLAWDKGKIVGARMFMFWEFRKGEKTIKAIRPVDTITHPDYRGKGIFKTLTLQGLEDCKGSYDFIFNTPNTNSFPGYIKMGWRNYEKELSYRLALNFKITKKGTLITLPLEAIDIKGAGVSQSYYRTKCTNDYVRWRYEDKDYQSAKFSINDRDLFLFFKIEKIKGLRVIIIYDLIGERKYHKSAVSALSAKLRVYLIYYLNTPLLDLNYPISMYRQDSKVVIKGGDNKISDSLIFSAGDIDGRL